MNQPYPNLGDLGGDLSSRQHFSDIVLALSTSAQTAGTASRTTGTTGTTTSPGGTTGGTTGTATSPAASDVDIATTGDRDADWGWLGLLGLIGLAGLIPRREEPQAYRQQDTTRESSSRR